MTQERAASRSRVSTARTNPPRSPLNDRRIVRLSEAGFSVTTRNIAARVSGAATGCARARKLSALLRMLFGSGSIGCSSWRGARHFALRNAALASPQGLRAKAYHRRPTKLHATSARGECPESIFRDPLTTPATSPLHVFSTGQISSRGTLQSSFHCCLGLPGDTRTGWLRLGGFRPESPRRVALRPIGTG